jgi:hypothetical protein
VITNQAGLVLDLKQCRLRMSDKSIRCINFIKLRITKTIHMERALQENTHKRRIQSFPFANFLLHMPN